MTKQLLRLTSCSALALASVLSPVRASETQTYTYDMHGHLVAVQYSGTVNNSQAHSVCYDLAGNRTKYKSDSGGAVAGCTSNPSAPPYAPPSFAIGDASGYEPDTVSFAVAKAGAAGASFSVNYATADGTATSTGDYFAASGTLTFAANEAIKFITISTRNNSQLEASEDFYINLSSPSGGATIADSQGVGSIEDDDDDEGGGGCQYC